MYNWWCSNRSWLSFKLINIFETVERRHWCPGQVSGPCPLSSTGWWLWSQKCKWLLLWPSMGCSTLELASVGFKITINSNCCCCTSNETLCSKMLCRCKGCWPTNFKLNRACNCLDQDAVKIQFSSQAWTSSLQHSLVTLWMSLGILSNEFRETFDQGLGNNEPVTAC